MEHIFKRSLGCGMTYGRASGGVGKTRRQPTGAVSSMGLAVPFAAVLCPARGRQPRIFIKPMIVMNLKAGLRL